MKRILILLVLFGLSSCKTLYELPQNTAIIYRENGNLYALNPEAAGETKKMKKNENIFIPEGELFLVLGRGKHLYSEHIPDYVYFFFFDGKKFSVFQAEDFQKKIIMTEKEIKKFFSKIKEKEIKKIKKHPYQIYWVRKKTKSPFH